jgi:hypothetical protein
MVRALVASMGLAASLLLTPVADLSPANASVTVNVNIGVGSNLNFGRGITCSQGARILRDRGFRNVTQRDCRGAVFVYRTDRRGSRYEISVRARDGRVLNYRRRGRS